MWKLTDDEAFLAAKAVNALVDSGALNKTQTERLKAAVRRAIANKPTLKPKNQPKRTNATR